MKSNLFYRVITGFLFVPALVYIAREGNIPFLVLIELGIFLSSYEFYTILEAKGLHPHKSLGILASLILGLTAYSASYIFTLSTITILFIVLSIPELTRIDPDRAIFHISTTYFGVVYTGWLFSHLILLREIPAHIGGDYGVGLSYVVLPFAIAWTGDITAFFVGSRFGRHKMLKRVSPAKSWEGAISGGLAATGALFTMRALYASYLSVADTIILGVLGYTVAVVGDLVESLLKRDANLKNVSTSIPGHGGVLDRFDSLLYTAPLVYYYLRFFVV
ncbi:MAG: phosphatidate cytidylyltransferase [bacterium]|nr:phosphatidate cytidylyltransferase [bacterium]